MAAPYMARKPLALNPRQRCIFVSSWSESAKKRLYALSSMAWSQRLCARSRKTPRTWPPPDSDAPSSGASFATPRSSSHSPSLHASKRFDSVRWSCAARVRGTRPPDRSASVLETRRRRRRATVVPFSGFVNGDDRAAGAPPTTKPVATVASGVPALVDRTPVDPSKSPLRVSTGAPALVTSADVPLAFSAMVRSGDAHSSASPAIVVSAAPRVST
mmetsp:Transcript_26384/g.79552  ORF Transcript_26384/g.79552 Transcript_26384/m.79552 type:complete len:216 (-) Transcript_26384:438-1085(-)